MPEKHNKFYCQNPSCDNQIPEPEMCCNGYECGCMGQPIEPPVCSLECFMVVYPWSNYNFLGPQTAEDASK